MTTEEAIKIFESWAECKYRPTHDAAVLALSALRAQQERENPKPMTNADRIRAISDEELAENRCIEIKGLYPWPIFVAFDVPEKRFLSRESAVAEELNWLQQPTEEG